MVKISQILDELNAQIICGNADLNQDIDFGFASDLMSDVLTIDSDNLLLVTGLNNLQTIRTSEMSDIPYILLVRDKKTSIEMKDLAEESGITIMECSYSMFRACSLLFNMGLEPVY